MNKKSAGVKPWNDVRTWKIVKNELKNFLDSDPRSNLEIIGKAGLSKDAYYKLFKGDRLDSPMRRATVEGLARALNLTCMFPHGGLPSFTTKELLTDSLNTANVKEAIEYAINIAGSIDQLAELTDIPSDELTGYIQSDDPSKPISILILHKIALAIDRTLIVFGDESISLVDDLGHDPKMQPTLVKIDLSTLAPVNTHYTPQILDKGLFKLMDNDIRLKHDITNDEIKVLSHIQDSRETDGTVDQWINILYAIRGLNSI